MNREDYLAAVTAELSRLTDAERDAVCGELAAHIEDHAEALRELGYAEEEADARATEQMGDPAQVGRDIAKLYRPFWLWVERLAGVLIAVMILYLLLGSAMLYHTWSSLYARVCTPEDEAAIRLDERMAVGDDVVRLYGISGYRPGEACEVRLWISAYDHVPLGIVYQNILGFLEIGAGEKEPEGVDVRGGTIYGSSGACYIVTRVPLAPEDTSITLRYARFGQVFECVIDLTEVSG